jgi:hypothetical protein
MRDRRCPLGTSRPFMAHMSDPRGGRGPWRHVPGLAHRGTEFPPRSTGLLAPRHEARRSRRVAQGPARHNRGDALAGASCSSGSAGEDSPVRRATDRSPVPQGFPRSGSWPAVYGASRAAPSAVIAAIHSLALRAHRGAPETTLRFAAPRDRIPAPFHGASRAAVTGPPFTAGHAAESLDIRRPRFTGVPAVWGLSPVARGLKPTPTGSPVNGSGLEPCNAQLADAITRRERRASHRCAGSLVNEAGRQQSAGNTTPPTGNRRVRRPWGSRQPVAGRPLSYCGIGLFLPQHWRSARVFCATPI